MDTNNMDEPKQTKELPGNLSSSSRRRRRRQSNLEKIRTRATKIFRLNIVIPLLVSIVIITISVFAVFITDSTSRLEFSWQSMNRILNSIEGDQGVNLTLNDFNRVRLGIIELTDSINSTHNRMRLISPIVSLNNDWKLSIELLEASKLVVSSTEDILDGVEPVINFLVKGEDEEAIASQISSGERLVELLEIGQISFLQANEKLSDAQEILDRLNSLPMSSEIFLNLEQVQQYHDRVLSINSALLTMPDMLSQVMGIDEEVTYLILAQNNDEIRPSGGYISTYGWLTLSNGRVTDYDYSATTIRSPSPPGEDFLDTFEIPDWWFNFEQPIYAAWDGSWYVDFPSTADMSINYYNAGKNPHHPVSGLIAIDITGFELILTALGEVVVEDYDRLVDINNFREVVYDIRTYGQNEHKEFLASLYRSIFENWQSVEQDSSLALINALLQALNQKHLLIYLPDSNSQEIIELLGWSGSQKMSPESDYILVADTNLGNKSNHSVIQSLTYDVEIQLDQSRTSNLRIQYDYFDTLAKDDPAVDPEFHGPIDYKTLTQIHLPANIEIIEEENLNQMSVVQDEESSLIITRVDVDYDTSERVQLKYSTPPVENSIGDFFKYQLLIQKQPGSKVQTMNLQIKLPPEAKVVSLSPEASAEYDLGTTILDFRLDLLSDQWIEVIYVLES